MRYSQRMKAACPICRTSTDSTAHPDFPFCSRRCRLLDLGNWASEKYVISSPAFDESMFENLEENLLNADEDEKK